MPGLLPASIRFNNPGGQYPGPSARQFNTTGTETIGGGHKIAVFATPEEGAAAQFHLLNRSYTGMPLSQAIYEWSGKNSSPAYTDFVSKQTGIAPDTVLTPEFLAGPGGLALAKAQAHWEAGRPSPLTDDQWQTAQTMGLGGQPGGSAPAQGIPLPAPQNNSSVNALVARRPPQDDTGQAAAALSSQFLNPQIQFSPMMQFAQLQRRPMLPIPQQSPYGIRT